MAIEQGVSAPLFEANDQNGNTIRLEDYRGKRVILFFYPKDDTPVCTAVACNFRDNFDSLTEQGYVLLGVSPDDASSHAQFATKFSYPFSLLDDSSKNIHELYGTWVERSMYGRKYFGTDRTTFVIDEEGNIAHVISKVDSRDHTAQILAL